MSRLYSQYGEDFLLWTIFSQRTSPGFFVEVGGLDGIRFSNTYSFEQNGWSGVCIEPHPEYFPLMSKHRPKSHCVRAAVGTHSGSIEFIADQRGEFSTIEKSLLEDDLYLKKAVGCEKMIVPLMTLDEILADIQAPTNLDFVSIDVEGAELKVLEGFDLSFYQPRILVIEANTEESNVKLDEYMKTRGYYKGARLNRTNNFYCLNFSDAIKLAFTPVNCTVSVAPHPLYPRLGIDDKWRKLDIAQKCFALETMSLLYRRLIKRLQRLGEPS